MADSKKIKKNEIGFYKLKIADVFKCWFTVPSYQRHYVWDSDNVNDLLSDFEDNYIEHKEDEYFLGSYIYQDKGNEYDLLDGQQRITTLFLLFAFLRDFVRTPESIKKSCKKYLYQEADVMEGIEEQVRLNYAIRGNVANFIKNNIVNENLDQKWNLFEKEKASNENESIRHICNTLCCFKQFFEEHSEIDITAFSQYICQNVVMIYVSAGSLEDAFRLFSIMNDRGLKLGNSDILKSSNLEQISNTKEMNECARQWEDLQSNLGTDFDRFLSYVRMTLLKTRQRTTLLDEFEKLIFKTANNKKPVLEKGKSFFDYVQESYKSYNKVIELDDLNDIPFCNLITVLKVSMPSTDWIPVIMQYYTKFGIDGLYAFTLKVACKNIADAVCGAVPTTRIDHLTAIMNAVETCDTSKELMERCSLFSFDSTLFISNIQSDVYGRRYTKALLMLLELDDKDKEQHSEWGMISIEHILPQTPKSTSQWVKNFTDQERSVYLHKLGNLCIIGRKKNSSLGNLDYQDKRKRYFEKNIGSFPHTLKIYNTYPSSWTPIELIENQKNTINQIKKIFGIS